MNRISDEQLQSLIEAGHETRNLEFKPGFQWDSKTDDKKWLTEKCIQTILAMTNTPSGGYLVIGVEEKDGRPLPKGVSQTQLESFEDFDGIKGKVDGFTYSSTEFDLSWGEYSGNPYIVFSIQVFYEWPVVCRHNGNNIQILRKDDIYARSRRSPYGSVRATEMELREIIKLAIKKEKAERVDQGWKKTEAENPEKFFTTQAKDLLD